MDEPTRNLWCSYYPFCLDVHVRYGKRRFDCSRCARYRPLHFQPEEILDDALACAEFLHELFLGVDPYERGSGMRRKILDQEMVTVPASIIRGFIYSLGEGVKYLQSSLNMARKLNEILDQGGSTNGQRAEVSEGGNTDTNS